MNEKLRVCGNCAYKSDAVNTRTPDKCYQWDKEVTRNAPACGEWRGSLRNEPLEGPPCTTS